MTVIGMLQIAERIAEFAARGNRIRAGRTRGLLAAAVQAGAARFLAQNIARTPPWRRGRR